jgi:LPS export ABC transporter protein LptC
MRIHYSKILRRWLIGVIFIVILAVLFNLSWNVWQAKKANNAKIRDSVGQLTIKSIESFENKNGIARFKVGALRVVKTDEGKDHLEGSIEASDLNPDGSERNKIRSQRAIYDKNRKLVDFSGDVRLFLENDIEMRTESLHYDLNSDVGATPDQLQFFSPAASGRARGIRFEQKTQSLELAGEVEFDLNQKGTKSGNSKEIGRMHASSERAYSSGTANKIIFQGKARIEAENYGTISGNAIEVILGSDQRNVDQRHVTSLVSVGNALYKSKDGDKTRVLSGNRMVFGIGESRALEKISVSGDAAFISNSAAEEENLRGGEIDLEFDAAQGVLNRIQGRLGVQFRMKRGMEQTLISGEQLNAQFAPETKSLTNIHVIKNAKLSAEGSKDTASNDLQSDDLQVSFRQLNERAVIKKVLAEGSVRWRSMPPKNSTAQGPEAARSLEAAKLELENSAEGDYLESGRANGKVVISETSSDRPIQPQVRHLSADSAQFKFFPKDSQLKEMNAEGHVKTTFEKKGKGPGGSPAVDNFQTASDKMKANFVLSDGRSIVQSAIQWGNFSYRDDAHNATAGRCDYEAIKDSMLLTESPKILDESSLTSGERIEYDRSRKVLSTKGNVQSRISSPQSAQKGGNFFFGSSATSSSSQSIVMADEMQYETATEHFRYSGNVRLLSENQQLHAQVLNIFNRGERVEAQGEIQHLVNKESQAKKTRNTQNSRESSISIRSERMQYFREGNELNYSDNVKLSSIDVKEMSSTNLKAKLDKDSKMIENATADGKVRIVHPEGRECKGEIARWSVDSGEFAVEGNPAEIYDPKRGRSSARQLTYFKASDRILLGKQ